MAMQRIIGTRKGVANVLDQVPQSRTEVTERLRITDGRKDVVNIGRDNHGWITIGMNRRDVRDLIKTLEDNSKAQRGLTAMISKLIERMGR